MTISADSWILVKKTPIRRKHHGGISDRYGNRYAMYIFELTIVNSGRLCPLVPRTFIKHLVSGGVLRVGILQKNGGVVQLVV